LKIGRKKKNMIVTSRLPEAEIPAAEAELGEEIIFVTYGELLPADVEAGLPERVVGTTERIGHFLEEGESYPQTEDALRTLLERIVS
jgi:hypothetical protein